ncbi:MAG TPA: hypothetical protein VG276_21425 [Actinomycetes bacterium]|jgi:hypothetical protein|nr:hypothetical protein [Actinomycetes bacterium]
MQFAIAIFTIGAVLILIGLVGGDLSYRGLTVPKVGVLPRFTTTIAGGVFLMFSLAVFVIAEFGHDVDSVPAAHAEVVAQGASGGGSSDPATSSRVDAVTVQFNDQLTDGALQEEIQVTVDGQQVGNLRADVTDPSATIEFSVEEGSHHYAMAGALQAQDGSEYTLAGEGTFEARAGASFDLSVTDSGELALSRRN